MAFDDAFTAYSCGGSHSFGLIDLTVFPQRPSRAPTTRATLHAHNSCRKDHTPDQRTIGLWPPSPYSDGETENAALADDHRHRRGRIVRPWRFRPRGRPWSEDAVRQQTASRPRAGSRPGTYRLAKPVLPGIRHAPGQARNAGLRFGERRPDVVRKSAQASPASFQRKSASSIPPHRRSALPRRASAGRSRR